MLHPVYYIIMLFMTYFSYLEVTNVNSIKSYIKINYIIVAVALIILAGIRIAGADYWPYLKLYFTSNQYIKWVNIFDTELGIEPSYLIISKIVGNLRLPFFVLLFIYATIAVTLKTYTYFKISPYPFFTLLFYFMPFFFFQEMGHIRQGAAIACCLFSYQYIAEKKLLKFLLCLIIGYSFHKTTIIFLPAYWIANLNISTIQSFLIIVISIILSPFEPYTWFGNFFNSISSGDQITEAFNSYQNLDKAGFSTNEIVKIIFIIIILIFDNNNIKTNPDRNYLKIRNLIVTYFCVYYSFRENMIFSIRLPVCYEAFMGILLAMIIKNNKTALSKFGLYCYIIIYLYLLSIRFWENSRKLNFDRFDTIFSEKYNNAYFIPPTVIN